MSQPDCLFCRTRRERRPRPQRPTASWPSRDIAPEGARPPARHPRAPRRRRSARSALSGRRSRSAMLAFVAETAHEAGLEDYRVIVNVGEGGGQTVFHLHWHVLGGQRPGRIRMTPHRRARRRPDRGDEGGRRVAARHAAPGPLGAARRREGAAAPAGRERGAPGAPARAQEARRGGAGVPRRRPRRAGRPRRSSSSR